jgi:hypothetical protein
MKIESTILKLPLAVLGKLTNDLFFSGLHGGKVGFRLGNIEAEDGAHLRHMKGLCGVDQGLGRHAPLEDA